MCHWADGIPTHKMKASQLPLQGGYGSTLWQYGAPLASLHIRENYLKAFHVEHILQISLPKLLLDRQMSGVKRKICLN